MRDTIATLWRRWRDVAGIARRRAFRRPHGGRLVHRDLGRHQAAREQRGGEEGGGALQHGGSSRHQSCDSFCSIWSETWIARELIS